MSQTRANTWLAQPQKKLGTVGLVVLLVVTSIVTPLSLDMYAPAIPHMTEYFDTSVDIVNFTLVGYFLFFAIGLLLFGPISDRYGRRPVMIAGMLDYALASAICALAPHIGVLIAARVLQALGAGAVSAVATAVIKDSIKPEKRELMLAIVQIMFVIGPVIAPVLGALILQVADWRMTFWALTGVGAVCSILSFLFEETLPQADRYQGTVLGSLKLLGTVAKNKGFRTFLIVAGLFNLPFMGYIAVGSYIYISFFGLSELEFSYFYGGAALFAVLGPFLWIRASKYVSARTYTTIMISVAAATGVAIVLTGALSPWLFCIIFIVFAICEASIRLYTTNILLDQDGIEAGAASSVINFTHTALGCVGMLFAVFPWPNFVVGIGALIAVTMLVDLVIWFVFLKSSIPLKGIK